MNSIVPTSTHYIILFEENDSQIYFGWLRIGGNVFALRTSVREKDSKSTNKTQGFGVIISTKPLIRPEASLTLREGRPGYGSKGASITRTKEYSTRVLAPILLRQLL